MPRSLVEETPKVQPGEGAGFSRIPDDYQRINATPDMFGAQVGAAEQRTGAELQRGGDDLIQAAILRQNRFNQITALNARNQLQDQWNKLAWGDPQDPTKKGYLQLDGADAMYQRPQIQQDMQNARDQVRGNLQNDAQRLEFDKSTEYIQMHLEREIGSHYETQFQKYGSAIAQASENNSIAGVVRDPLNDRLFQDTVANSGATIAARVHSLYGERASPELVTSESNKYMDSLIESRTLAMATLDPTKARAFLEQNRSSLENSGRYLTIDRELQNLGRKGRIAGAIERSFQEGPLGEAAPAQAAPAAYSGMVRDASQRENVPESVLNWVIKHESGFNPNAQGIPTHAGTAKGIAQFMDATARQFGIDPFKPEQAIPAAAKYLRHLYDENGSWEKAVETYGTFSTGKGEAADQKVRDDFVGMMARGGGIQPAAAPSGAPDQVVPAPGAAPGPTTAGGQVMPGGQAPAAPAPAERPIPPREAEAMQRMGRAYHETRDMEPEDREAVVGGVWQRIQREWTMEDRAKAAQDKQRRDAAEASGNRVVTQLMTDPTKLNPDMIANDPNLTYEQKYHLFQMSQTALAKDDGGDVKTYGPKFWDLFQRVHAPAGDQNRISDPSVLWAYGPRGDLTASGIAKLTSEIQGRRTPEGEAAAEMKRQFLQNARAQITGANDGLHIRDPRGDELYLKFLAQALPTYDAGLKAGKMPEQMLNPDSKDYIGASIATFRRPVTEWAQDLLLSNNPEEAAKQAAAEAAKKAAAKPADLTTQEGIVAAYTSGRLTRDQAAAALIKGGFARAQTPAPPPPATLAAPAAPQVPIH